MMLFFYRVLPLLLIPLYAVAAYFFLCRMLRTWRAQPMLARSQRRTLVLISMLLALPMAKITSLWTLFLLLLAGFVLLWEAAFALLHHLGKRRFPRLQSSGALALLCALVVLIAGCLNATHIQATHYTLHVSLPEKQRILFLSDLHYPTTMDARSLSQLCARLSDEQADLLILGGDIVDENTSEEELSAVFEQLGAVDTTYGVYFVYGNHDNGYYAGASDRPQALARALAQNDICVLRDASLRIDDSLVLIGRDDAKHPIAGKRTDIATLLAQAADGYRIVIDHQPLSLEENEQAGVDLLLSGHTHNGQVFPIGAISSLLSINEQTYGLQTKNGFVSIVSSGAGCWGYPFRSEGICEYVVIDLI